MCSVGYSSDFVIDLKHLIILWTFLFSPLRGQYSEGERWKNAEDSQEGGKGETDAGRIKFELYILLTMLA